MRSNTRGSHGEDRKQFKRLSQFRHLDGVQPDACRAVRAARAARSRVLHRSPSAYLINHQSPAVRVTNNASQTR